MKQNNFVSFSSMLKNREQTKSTTVEDTPEVDYEALFHQSQEEQKALQEQIALLQNEKTQIQQEQQQQHNQHTEMIAVLEKTVADFREEIRNDVGAVFVAFLQTIIKDSRFHSLALQDMLTQALIELSDKKTVLVHVPENLMTEAQKFLSAQEGWDIVGEDSSLEVQAQAEGIRWENRLHPVFEEFLSQIEIWLQESR